MGSCLSQLNLGSFKTMSPAEENRYFFPSLTARQNHPRAEPFRAPFHKQPLKTTRSLSFLLFCKLSTRRKRDLWSFQLFFNGENKGLKHLEFIKNKLGLFGRRNPFLAHILLRQPQLAGKLTKSFPVDKCILSKHSALDRLWGRNEDGIDNNLPLLFT